MFGDLPAMTLTGEDVWPVGSQWRRNPVPACHGPGAANAYGRGGGNQSGFPNKGGTHSCSKESYRCPSVQTHHFYYEIHHFGSILG